MSTLLTTLNDYVGSTVWVYLSSGATAFGTLTSVAADLTLVAGQTTAFTLDSAQIVGFAV